MSFRILSGNQPRIALVGISVAFLAGAVSGQPDYGARLGLQQGGEARLYPQGVAPTMGAIDPTVRKWYLPEEFFEEYRWRQWETTSYTRQPFQRYVGFDEESERVEALDGSYFYDLYGNVMPQGWLLYNTSQETPANQGNIVFTGTRMSDWFNGVAIASESKGQYRYALNVGSDLRTSFTPLVWSKPRFAGVQLDLMTDKYRGSLIYSQGGVPGRDDERPKTDVTVITGGRFTAQLGDFVETGVHFVNARQNHSLNSRLANNTITGSLLEAQNGVVSQIQITLRDDSPEDGIGGPAFFPAGSDLIITYLDGSQDRGKDLRFEPIIAGGIPGPGYQTADGDEEITLIYDFSRPEFIARASADRSEIVDVEFRLVLANDYQIWMASNLQSRCRSADEKPGCSAGAATPVPLLVERAEGNVQDFSNVQLVSFEYGLPTATHIVGTTIKLNDVAGFDLYGEYDLNWNYRKYPNPQVDDHTTTSGIIGKRRAPAWMLNVSKQLSTLFVFGEFYSIDPLYNTTSFTADVFGDVDYADPTDLFDFVEDNDDQDRFPDLRRVDSKAAGIVDQHVFPGWDRDYDFLPDVNRNNNRIRPNTIPDYEEPFLRFGADRPEFLFGVDMNHNFWVDLYENDNEPDYPYRKGHRGFNAFSRITLNPGLDLKIGALRTESIASVRRNNATYTMLTFDRSLPRWGRLRVFEMAQLVKDDIPDPLMQWAPDSFLDRGSLVELDDPLLARDTWVNHLFAGHTWRGRALFMMSKVNWIYFRQRLDRDERRELGLSEEDYFFGILNKASYRYTLGPLELEPRWKSEFIDQSRDLFAAQERTTLSELVSVLVRMRLLGATTMQSGVEYLWSEDLDGRDHDLKSWNLGIQFLTESAYQGYSLRALVGAVWERTKPAGRETSTTAQSFITVYAGLQ